ILVRPVTRPSYLFSRWLASSLAAIGLTLGMLGIAVALVSLRHAPPAAEVIGLALGAITTATGSAAVMILLSTLVGGLGDIAIYFAAIVTLQILGGLAMLKHWAWLTAVVEQLQKTLMPEVSFGWLGAGSPVPWFALASWASTVTLALAIGIA